MPKLRFKRFTDDWEQRKVIDIAPLQRGFDLPTTEMKPGEYPVVMSNGIGGWHSEYKAKGPGVITGRSGTIGKLHYVESDYWPHNTTLWVTDFKGNNPKFVYHLYDRLDLSRFGTGSGVPTLNRNDVHDTKVNIPAYEEQKKIADYLDRLDNLITLHQRKCDELQKVKKYMLQKMFPKKGEKVPEIRLAGFTGDWELRKLGEITTKIGSGKTPRGGSEAYVDDGISLIRSQNVHDDVVDLSDVVYIDEETNKSMENSLVAYNDVLLNITGASIGRSAVYKGSEPANVNQHVCIIRPTEDYSPDFIQMNLASSNGQKQIDSSQAGGAREGLNFQQIGKMKFAFPSVKEQKKIGMYFSNLNNLIALHQRKCDTLKEIKKYMLQNMFPNK